MEAMCVTLSNLYHHVVMQSGVCCTWPVNPVKADKIHSYLSVAGWGLLPSSFTCGGLLCGGASSLGGGPDSRNVLPRLL